MNNIKLSLGLDEEYDEFEIYSNEENYSIILAEFFKDEIKKEIESIYIDCEYGYILANDGKCREIKSEDCSFNFIIINYKKLKFKCCELCEINKMVLI